MDTRVLLGLMVLALALVAWASTTLPRFPRRPWGYRGEHTWTDELPWADQWDDWDRWDDTNQGWDRDE